MVFRLILLIGLLILLIHCVVEVNIFSIEKWGKHNGENLFKLGATMDKSWIYCEFLIFGLVGFPLYRLMSD